MTISGKSLHWICPACPQMIITMASNNHLCILFISQYIAKCQEKNLYIVYSADLGAAFIALSIRKYAFLAGVY